MGDGLVIDLNPSFTDGNVQQTRRCRYRELGANVADHTKWRIDKQPVIAIDVLPCVGVDLPTQQCDPVAIVNTDPGIFINSQSGISRQ